MFWVAACGACTGGRCCVLVAEVGGVATVVGAGVALRWLVGDVAARGLGEALGDFADVLLVVVGAAAFCTGVNASMRIKVISKPIWALGA